jgi:FlaA1/EpsC-like NDP-sugar epimerase
MDTKPKPAQNHLRPAHETAAQRARLFMRPNLIRVGRMLADCTVLSAAIWGAFLLRFEGDIPLAYIKRLVFLWPYVVGVQMILMMSVGVPQFAWRYVGMREAARILFATGCAAIVLLALRIGGSAAMEISGYAQFLMLPVGVVLIDLMLAFLGVTGIRAVWRGYTERSGVAAHQKVSAPVEQKRTLLIGAGQAGLLMAREIQRRPDLGIRPIGFVDDKKSKHGLTLHGLKVRGTVADIPALCLQYRIDQALITIGGAKGDTIRRIRDRCSAAGIEVNLIPGLYEIAGGKVNLSQLRPVTIEDLLRREPVQLAGDELRQTIADQCVMVTGAGGSIGLGLCRQILKTNPRALLMVERAEGSLFEAHQALLAEFPQLAARIEPLIADVSDRPRIDGILTDFQPSLILHAAAHKHVPMMEWNPAEAIKNNIIGTRILADLAHAHGVERFVMVSTDKAVNPTSVMGCSKRIAEMYVQSLSAESPTRFVTVRFGNVLASAGSVVPIFQKQIAAGGPVTVTDPEMKRYFMTIPEACQLVLEAGSIGTGGEIFILDMGEPVKIVDLAEDLIRLSGLTPGDDIEIEFSGTRPGEKLYEELSVSGEVADKTKHPKIFIGRFRATERPQLLSRIDDLHIACHEEKRASLLQRLAEIVPEYTGADGPGAAGDTVATAKAAGE